MCAPSSLGVENSSPAIMLEQAMWLLLTVELLWILHGACEPAWCTCWECVTAWMQPLQLCTAEAGNSSQVLNEGCQLQTRQNHEVSCMRTYAQCPALHTESERVCMLAQVLRPSGCPACLRLRGRRWPMAPTHFRCEP